jgi:predicted DsbA family dithiol-disulfide isomerase
MSIVPVTETSKTDIPLVICHIQPNTFPPAVEKRAYFKGKYGAGVESFFSRLQARGDPLGIKFKWDGLSGSSRDSHKLVLRARDLDKTSPSPSFKQQALLDILFRASFEECQDISDRSFLARAAVEAGVVDSEEEAMTVMESEEMGRRVELENLRAREREIEAVPSYLVQGRYCVGGMQEAEVFLEVFGRVGQKADDGDREVRMEERQAEGSCGL